MHYGLIQARWLDSLAHLITGNINASPEEIEKTVIYMKNELDRLRRQVDDLERERDSSAEMLVERVQKDNQAFSDINRALGGGGNIQNIDGAESVFESIDNLVRRVCSQIRSLDSLRREALHDAQVFYKDWRAAEDEIARVYKILNDVQNELMRYKSRAPETGALCVGDTVRKVQGYAFPGIVVACFAKLNGGVRYVVESTSPDTQGLLHVFNENQLEKVGENDDA